jgi:hypothetical protein
LAKFFVMTDKVLPDLRASYFPLFAPACCVSGHSMSHQVLLT